MELQDVYITQLCIRNVRHLKDIMIPVSSPEKPDKKHLIITGKNGSGKTSLLEALAQYLNICGSCINKRCLFGFAGVFGSEICICSDKTGLYQNAYGSLSRAVRYTYIIC